MLCHLKWIQNCAFLISRNWQYQRDKWAKSWGGMVMVPLPINVCARVVIDDIRMCACNNSRIIGWILMKINTNSFPPTSLCEISGSHGGSMKMLVFWDIVPCWWRQDAPPKRRSTSRKLHSTVSQKAIIFKVTVIVRLTAVNQYPFQVLYIQYWSSLYSYWSN
jgi:hypothetical protein